MPYSKKTDEHTCCICGKPCKGFGNNPEPVKQTGRCCDDCNIAIVVPARIFEIEKQKELQ